MYATVYARALGQLVTAAVIAATAAAAPAALRAQASLEPVRVTARRTLEAEELERRALDIVNKIQDELEQGYGDWYLELERTPPSKINPEPCSGTSSRWLSTFHDQGPS